MAYPIKAHVRELEMARKRERNSMAAAERERAEMSRRFHQLQAEYEEERRIVSSWQERYKKVRPVDEGSDAQRDSPERKGRPATRTGTSGDLCNTNRNVKALK